MKIKMILAVVFAVILSGCVGIPDAEGWTYSKKNEFLEILETDKYASICNKEALYEQVKSSENSKLMTKLLVAYSKNLANGCIDLKSFNRSQYKKQKRNVGTHYEIYLQEVSKEDIKRKLKAGESIENILAPYVPKNEQFAKLVQHYRTLAKEASVKPSQLHSIRLSIERVKLMNDNLGEDYVLINIPEFVVRVKHDSKTNMKFKVIVGKRHLQTPIFAAPLRYVTINPQWSVPDSIARNEIIPDMLKKAGYLARKNLVIRKSYDLNSKAVDPKSVDWSKYVGGKGHVPYKFIEIPSNRNVLGRVKFIFTNKHAVYMHDTQAKRLFKRKVRAYSHGCVRLEKPSSLLDYVTTNYSSKSNAQVRKWYNSSKMHHLNVEKRVMVHTAYLTAYVNEEGKLHLFKDIYGYNKSQKLTF